MLKVKIVRALKDESTKVGDIYYHDHELLRVTRRGRIKKMRWGATETRTYSFRVIGKVNLDKSLRAVSQEAETPRKEQA